MAFGEFALPHGSSDKQQIDWPAEAQIEARVAGYTAHVLPLHRATMAVQRIALCALACVSCTAALAGPASKPRPATVRQAAAAATEQEPLLLRAARGEKVERTPVWMMRQAGRHMKVYRDLVAKYPTFRERSEIPEAALEISLQPFRAYGVDGVILFSDILTPLPAMGVEF